jgi:divalent metal cation (Fe/Co/Zn/Cd) transporter
VAGMICMTGADILGESIKQLFDTNNEDLVETIDKMVRSSVNVLSVQRIRARQVYSDRKPLSMSRLKWRNKD